MSARLVTHLTTIAFENDMTGTLHPKAIVFAALVGGLVMPSCRRSEDESHQDSPLVRSNASSLAALSDSALDELQYPAGPPFPGGRVKLHKGDWEGMLDSTVGSGGRGAVSLSQVTRGDLTGDGQPEAVVVLTSNPGATGTFYDLIPVFLDSAPSPVRVPRVGRATSVGDRIRFDTLWIAGERVWLRMVTQGADDGLCCPTQREERRYRLIGDSLALDSTRVLGRLTNAP